MNIKNTFLSLTSKTYPHGTETELLPILYKLVPDLETDDFGNLFIQIGKSDVMFTSHLDTATSANTKVNHVFDGDIIKTDGKSILGADDKAGVTVMLNMIINKIPGLYYFFLGEEVGCIGSKKVAGVQKETKIPHINKVISFDRRGTKSIITYQAGKRCASDEFGKALADELNLVDKDFKYEIDPTGVLTDSAQFISIYPECTNISVGYQSEHTFSETQDIRHLEKLAEACLKVNWGDLPVKRDPSITEWKSYYWGPEDDDWDSYNYGNYGYSSKSTIYNNWGTITKPKPKVENVWFHDTSNNYVSCIKVEEWTKKIIEVDLHINRIVKEKSIIDELMLLLDLGYKSSCWDGMKYRLTYTDGIITECDRNDLISYLPELDYSNGDNLIDDGDDYIGWGNEMCDGFFD
jgi:hypothetical protein